ncbi:hypothetical protein [Microtetraspora sp. NBRC 16547]|uniref:hypothetical protein n=1 Tax=Microtetraspora sp. NBRC 16547 TaxID=3030993 RepID=UPI0024A5B0E0|nr:hypothetical protein [Microtetraspora sp. NBRC 16547]GLW96332.1 hypothetical protein Misp02_04190 [Microtetraspora sp. NBRC 16547]
MRRILIAVLAALTVGLAATVAWLYTDLSRIQSGVAAGREAMTAARSYAADMLSYDYRTTGEDLARARSHTTGALAGRYARLARTLPPLARQRQEVRQAVVAAAAVESATPEEVRILVFLNMVTSSREPGQDRPRQEVSQNRLRLVMTRENGRWLVSDLSTLLGDTPVP